MTASLTLQETYGTAIAAHAGWNVRFRDCLSGKLARDPAVVEQPNICLFGKWLEQDGQHHMDADIYTELHALHTQFHHVAATIVRLVHDGKIDQAHEMMDMGSLFAHTSAKLTLRLTQLRNAAEKGM
jgi:Chemoreceptor zinc-binding domain